MVMTGNQNTEREGTHESTKERATKGYSINKARDKIADSTSKATIQGDYGADREHQCTGNAGQD